MCNDKGTEIPLQAWTGREGSRRLRLPDFTTPTHWPPLPPGNIPGNHFSQKISELQGLPEGLRQWKNRTRDLPAFSVVIQPNAPPRAPTCNDTVSKISWHTWRNPRRTLWEPIGLDWIEFVSSDLHVVQGNAAITIRDRDVQQMALNSNPSALCVSSSSHSLFSKPVCAGQQTDRVLTFALTYILVGPDDLQHRILNSRT